MTRPETPLLDRIAVPSDLRQVDPNDLRQVADELRAEMIDAVSVTGGHLGSGLGVVELTVAIHHVFDTPRDRLIWDVGHQCYPHKILTGRRDRIRTLRQGGGLSGFTKRSESEYDPFGAAHSSTSISAGLGMAVARDLGFGPNGDSKSNNIIAVIGDGAMSAGMAYEAMNNAGDLKRRLIVILNDNDMSIAPPTGALNNYLSRLLTSKSFQTVRRQGVELAKHLPRPLETAARRAEEYARGMVQGGTLFEEMGFFYVGPIDGHNMDVLVDILTNARDSVEGPIMIHCVTEKGKGYDPAEQSADKYHGVQKFDTATGVQQKPKPAAPSYQNVFGEVLARLADKDPKIATVTAAMPGGTGVNIFAKAHPDRSFDVGIAEQHGVTFAAGLASEGMRPFCAIYSTFLQRAYDQVVHDVAIQSLPVRFAMDRAGFVGADGQTHHGSYDLAYLCCLPNMVVCAPSDEAELARMLATLAKIDDRPSAIRYPRGEGVGVEIPDDPAPLPIGEGRIVRDGTRLAFLTLGPRLHEALAAAETLAGHGITPTIADARWAKPIDDALIEKLAANHEALIIVEEGAMGGFGAHALQHLSDSGALDRGLKVRTLRFPDHNVDHDKPALQYDLAGLNAPQLVDAALALLDRPAAAAAG